jgi:hypothetical protein
MRQFIIAKKRGVANPLRLTECLLDDPEVRVTGSPGPDSTRIQIEATDAAIDRLRSKIGEWCYIEPIIIHHAV